MMCWRIHLCLLIAFVRIFCVAASTDANDIAALRAQKDSWNNVPPSWANDDPCGSHWDGINCTNNRVISITLTSINLSGRLSSDITGLSELQTLDLSYNNLNGPLPESIGELKKLSSLILVGCGLSGPIPHSIGSLPELVSLLLNSNSFYGEIPPSIGNLSKLYVLDLADNKLTGSIPVSNESTPGLDMLVNTLHFHLGKNQLSGEIPFQLFSSDMKLIHLRLDRNLLSESVPENLNNLTRVQELALANNDLTGPLPNLISMKSLNYVDFSNNSFDVTDVPHWFSSLQSLTSLIMENTNIRGQLPVSLFSLSALQTVVLKNNQINGTLDINSRNSNQLQLIDLQNNLIKDLTTPAGYNFQIILVGNPICDHGGVKANYCTIPQQSNSSYSTPAENCTTLQCNSDKVPSPTCKCAYPYSGNLFFRAPSFSSFGNESLFKSLEQKLMDVFMSHSQPVDSVSVGNPKNIDGYLVLNLQVFPSGKDHFNRTGISGIGSMLSSWPAMPAQEFGAFYFIANDYNHFEESHKSSSTTVIIGAAVGGSVLVLLLLAAGVYAFRQRKRAETTSKRMDPFSSWDPNSDSGGVGVPQLKGARCFSFEEIKKCTNNFSETNDIGSGGFGKVYRGTLPNGQLVAIKRARQVSTQGGLQFKTEIELLSRVHHKNVVSLVGFCFDQGEQMLVYEYMANGTLKDSLTGKTGIKLDWMRRLRIALGAARGVQYLHELANPPIIHRDIKSNNILLDERLNAKVADFGLCKPMVEPDKSHITTQVKGTMGYMDPEYYLTQLLTEKSDVYSFGVLLLELLTSKTPIVKGKYIVREVKEAIDRTKDLYNLEAILDPMVASNMAPGSVEKIVDLALRCIQELGTNRPRMSEVVKEIENIMEMAGLHPITESASTSDNYEGASKGSSHLYSNESLFNSSRGGYSPTKLEPK